MRELQRHTGAVAGARIAAGGSAMRQVLEEVERLLEDRVRAATVDLSDEAEATRVVLVRRIVQPLCVRQSAHRPRSW